MCKFNETLLLFKVASIPIAPVGLISWKFSEHITESNVIGQKSVVSKSHIMGWTSINKHYAQ